MGGSRRAPPRLPLAFGARAVDPAARGSFGGESTRGGALPPARMPQPPSESGNVVDPEVLASRRARRAEVGEDASLELRLFEAERGVGEVAAERDALRAQIAEFERDLRGTRQREWAEQQQRLEAQGEVAAARELA